MNQLTTIQARPEAIVFFATRNKCLQCKRRFERPYILPVNNPTPGQFQPNFNVEALFHMSETHGIPDDTFREWVTGTIYGQELGDLGIRAGQLLAGIHLEDTKL